MMKGHHNPNVTPVQIRTGDRFMDGKGEVWVALVEDGINPFVELRRKPEARRTVSAPNNPQVHYLGAFKEALEALGMERLNVETSN